MFIIWNTICMCHSKDHLHLLISFQKYHIKLWTSFNPNQGDFLFSHRMCVSFNLRECTPVHTLSLPLIKFYKMKTSTWINKYKVSISSVERSSIIKIKTCWAYFWAAVEIDCDSCLLKISSSKHRMSRHLDGIMVMVS